MAESEKIWWSEGSATGEDLEEDDDISSLGDELPDPGVGFIGGPVWHYPEEEIQFYCTDERSTATACSKRVKKTAMSDSYDGSAHDDGKARKKDEQTGSLGAFEWNATFDVTNRIQGSALSHGRQRRRRTLPFGHRNEDPKIQRFQEAARSIPFEYTSHLATMCVRRPYGIPTEPELFRRLAPEVSNYEYSQRSTASAAHTIQVGITVGADQSLMLLYGPAGVRYKKHPNDTHWTDVPDIGDLDVPLGYVHHTKTIGEDETVFEYSLDEVLEEAMLVREQYCSTLLSAALDLEQHQLVATTTTPPSLAKSIVSTPPRTTMYYYDGSGSTGSRTHPILQRQEEESASVKGKRLDFLQCVSPSIVSAKSKGTLHSRLTKTSRQQNQRQRRRKRVYRFCQKVVIIVIFYCSGILLVANLSSSSLTFFSLDNDGQSGLGGDSRLLAMLFPFPIPNERHDETEDRNHTNLLESFLRVFDSKILREVESLPPGLGSLEDNESSFPHRMARTVDHWFRNVVKERTEQVDCTNSLEAAFNETLSFQRELEMTQLLLQDESRNRKVLAKQYDKEQSLTKTLLREKEEAMRALEELRIETESLRGKLDREGLQNAKLEKRIRGLEEELVSMKEEQRRKESAKSSIFNNASTVPDTGLGKTNHQIKGGNDGAENTKTNLSMALKKNHSSTKKMMPSTIQEWFGPPSVNELQSFQNVFLHSARADKGPLFPKVYRRITKHVLPMLGMGNPEVTPSNTPPNVDNYSVVSDRRKLQNLAGKMVRKVAVPIRSATMHSIEGMKEGMKVATSVARARGQNLPEQWKEEASRVWNSLVDSIPPEAIETTKAIPKHIQDSKEKVIQRSKEGAIVVRQRVQKNFEEATYAGIGKLDRGQETIALVSGFARRELQSLGKKAARFWKLHRKRSKDGNDAGQSLQQLGKNQYYQGFVGSRKVKEE